MTAPDLTPEQRERGRGRISDALGLEVSPDGDPEYLLTRDADGVVVEGSDWSDEVTAVARMVADARAEGERQGAARVAAAVEALAQHEDRLARGFADTFWHDYTARVLRAALAQATGEQS